MEALTLQDGVWLLPLRGRVEGLRRLIGAVEATEPGARVVAIVDSGDPLVEDLLCLLRKVSWPVVICQGNPTTVEKLNYALCALPDEGFYGFLASDVEPRTKGWGAKLVKSLPPWGLSYPDDGIQGRYLATHPCVCGKLIKALGWWAYPKAKHNGIDVYLMQLAGCLGGLSYCPEVVFQHSHPTCKTAPDDLVYERARLWADDDRIAGRVWETVDAAEHLHRLGKLRGVA